MQRNPAEHPDLMKLEVVEIEDLKPAGLLKVILLKDVEGLWIYLFAVGFITQVSGVFQESWCFYRIKMEFMYHYS